MLDWKDGILMVIGNQAANLSIVLEQLEALQNEVRRLSEKVETVEETP